jgi:hypothetical protein
LNFVSNIRTELQPESETIKTIITTEVEETKISQRNLVNESTSKHEFDLSARKFIDWMDSIERILDSKQSNQFTANERQEIVQVDK